MDPYTLTALTLAAVLAALLIAVAVGRARRWGARCTRCDWTSRHLTRTRAELAAHRHRPRPDCDVKLWHRTTAERRGSTAR